MNDNAKVRFHIDKTGFFAESAMIFFLLSAIFRFIGCWGIWRDPIGGIMLLLLPTCSSLLMILAILLFGKKGFFLSFIPVLLGVVFFVFRAFSSESWVRTVLCILLNLIIAVVYTGTVFGWIRTKWLLPPIFGLLFLYRLAAVDIPALSTSAEQLRFIDGMDEMSVLCIMVAMFCIGMGLVKKSRPSAAATPEPAPAPAAEAAPVQPAETTAQPAPAPAAEENPILTEPYTPMLTLEPDPIGTENDAEENTDESEHE